MQFIDLKRQFSLHRDELLQAISDVLESGQYILGPKVQEVEERLASFCGARHCVTAASGTDTLLIALMALGIGHGDEVITSPFTFIAPAEMIALSGATPVFVDIDEKNFNINPALIEEKITRRTKAIIPVSLFGQMADMDAINHIAKKHSLFVIEDGAQSFGARQGASSSCAASTIGSTSFYPSKPLGCYGDGGALFTDDDGIAKLMREIRNHGSTTRYYHERLGFNGRFDAVQAAVIGVKLNHYSDELRMRQKIAATYNSLLQGLCQIPHVEENHTHIYSYYSILHDERDQLAAWLAATAIPTCIHYPLGLHEQPVFRYLGYRTGDFPVTERTAKRILHLPLHPWLSEEELQMVATAIERFELTLKE